MDRERGFTLAEMLVVIAIIGLLAAFGYPAMNKFLATQAVRNASYDLFADLIYARSEAIARGTTVTIAATTSPNFKLGYTVTENSGNTVLRAQPARDSQIEFTGSVGTVTFDRSGRASTQITFNIVPYNISNPQDYMKRCIRLDPSGRPKSAEGACA